MCVNCGCGKPNERHRKTDITLGDLTAAGKPDDLSAKKVAENIRTSVEKAGS